MGYKMMKAFVLVLAVLSVSCQTEKYIEETLKFLGGNLRDDPGKVIISECMENAPLQLSADKVTPEVIVKGEDINIKVIGTMIQDAEMDKLHVITYFTGKSKSKLDERDGAIEQKKVAAGEDYHYEFTAPVPKIVPIGLFEIFMNLLAKDGTQLQCLKATFQTTE